MSMFLCFLWWILLGSLLGWLASWLLGKSMEAPTPAPVERIVDRIVEKVVEKPVDRIVEKEKIVDRPVDRIVEKLVDNPAHLARITVLEGEVALIAGLRSQVQQLQAAPPKVVEKVIEKVVDKVVPVDVSAARALGFALKADDDLEIIEGIGPKIAELLRADGITTFHQLADTSPEHIRGILDKAGPNFRVADPGTWPEQADLAARNRWSALAALQAMLDAGVRTDPRGAMNALESQIAERDAEIARLSAATPVAIDTAAAQAAGFSVQGADDIEIVEGIGPKIAELLRAAGLGTFSTLGASSPSAIRAILDKAGPAFQMANPETWPEQSALAAGNHWRALRALQDVLTAGNR